jgi:hypothetical protein
MTSSVRSWALARGRLGLAVVCILTAAGLAWRFISTQPEGNSSQIAATMASPRENLQSESASHATAVGADPATEAARSSNDPAAGGRGERDSGAGAAMIATPETSAISPSAASTAAPGLAATLEDLGVKPTSPEPRRRFRFWYPCAPGAQANSGDYEFWADSTLRVTGSHSARISSHVPTPSPAGAGFCQMFRADEYRGKRVAFSGHLRTRNSMPGGQLVIRADARDGRIVAQAQLREGVVPGDLDWYRHTLVIDIPESAHLVMVGAVLINTGSLWIDDVSLEVVDAGWPLTSPARGPSGYSGTQPSVMVNLPPRLQDPGFEITYVKTGN